MKLKIVQEASIDKRFIFFNIYQDNTLTSSHSNIEEAEAAILKIEEVAKFKPIIIKEIEI